jgi:hypothetical protein
MRNLIIVSIGFYIAACGGKNQESNTKVVSVEDYETSTFTVGAGDGAVQGLLGTVTDDELERVFAEHREVMMRCYENALEDLEEIEGEVRFDMEVASDGTINSAFVSSSDLGSSDTESCMLDIVKNLQFKRVSGGLAMINYPLTLDAPYDFPEPSAWTNNTVESVLSEHQSEISGCIQGRSGAHVTLYVGKGGMVLSSGASGDTKEAYESASCIASSAKTWTFSAPLGDLAKVRLDF